MAENLIRMSPKTCAYLDEKHSLFLMDISLPGVKKSDIDLRMQDDSFYLKAHHENIEYVSSLALSCPVKAKEAKAKYENGLLRIEAPFKDEMAGSVKIKVE